MRPKSLICSTLHTNFTRKSPFCQLWKCGQKCESEALKITPVERSVPCPVRSHERLRSPRSGKDLIGIAEIMRFTKVLRDVWRGEPYKVPATVPLVQAINHATEHRAQVVTILTQQGVEPPDLSGWAYTEATSS